AAAGRLVIEDSEADLARHGDVLRLSYVISLMFERVGGKVADAADARDAHLLAPGVEDVPLDVVHGDGVRSEKQRPAFPEPFRILAERTTVPDSAACVHDVQDALLPDDRMADHRRDEGDHGNALRARVRPKDVVDEAVAHVLERAGRTRGMMVLQT